MNRRASLPGADELFRPTAAPPPRPAEETPAPKTSVPAQPSGPAGEDVSGRVRHDSKITVYLTGQELLDLEQARLRLRAEFDIHVDRGRIVREAVGELLRSLDEDGPDSFVVRRLS